MIIFAVAVAVLGTGLLLLVTGVLFSGHVNVVAQVLTVIALVCGYVSQTKKFSQSAVSEESRFECTVL